MQVSAYMVHSDLFMSIKCQILYHVLKAVGVDNISFSRLCCIQNSFYILWCMHKVALCMNYQLFELGMGFNMRSLISNKKIVMWEFYLLFNHSLHVARYF